VALVLVAGGWWLALMLVVVGGGGLVFIGVAGFVLGWRSWTWVSFGLSVLFMDIGSEISVVVDGVPVVAQVLGCDLLEPLGCEERWLCRVDAGGVVGVVVVCLWAGVIVDQSSFAVV
jgi:hypothetical protein